MTAAGSGPSPLGGALLGGSMVRLKEEIVLGIERHPMRIGKPRMLALHPRSYRLEQDHA